MFLQAGAVLIRLRKPGPAISKRASGRLPPRGPLPGAGIAGRAEPRQAQRGVG